MFVVTVAVLVLPAFAHSQLQRFEYAEMHMGVRTRIALYAPDTMTAQRAARAAFQRVALLDSLMSDYRSDSELARLSLATGGAPINISKESFYVMSYAQELARLSGGAFDITAGPLVRLWRSARRDQTLPSQQERGRALSSSGWRHLQLDSVAQTAQLLRPGMQLDLGGIAKGYAADQALSELRAHGVERALVEMGGDIVASGPPPGKRGWRVRAANAPRGKRSLLLAQAAISTSGDTEQFAEIRGIRYSHVVDPTTGMPLTSRVAATVIGPNGITSDALSTLLAVLGPERGRAFVAAHFPGVTAYIRRAGKATATGSSASSRPRRNPPLAQSAPCK